MTSASAVAAPSVALADGAGGAAVGPEQIDLTVFWREGCPHCKAEFEFLDGLEGRFPSLKVKAYEVGNNPDNARIFKEFMEKSGQSRAGVPTTIIGNAVFIGFSENVAHQIEQHVRLLSQGLMDGQQHQDNTFWIPLMGQVSPDDFSLPVLTLIIAGADSINPCALFVLLFLLTLLVHIKSRTRMAIVGGTFVFFSALVYFMFMAAWFTLFTVLEEISVITPVAGSVAIIIGAINIKDFFVFKRGVSLTLSDDASSKLINRMRGLLNASSMPSMLVGAVVLAVAANSYELLCTVGLPMVYVKILTLREMSTASYYSYLVFYNLVYVIPLLVLVVIFTMTLGARKLSEWQGRVLKLLSGVMMVTLGGVLALKPALLGNFFAMVGLMAVAISISLGVSLLMRPQD